MAATPWRRILFGFALIFCIGPAAAAEPVYPQLSGRIVDDADLLSPADRAELNAELKALEDKSSDQLVVVTLPSLQGYPIEDYGYQLGRHWGIGQKEKNSGALLIVAPNERKVRLEVGYGLEGQLTDAVSKLIIENSIVPRFRAGDVAGGITRGVDDVIQALTIDPEEWKARAKQRPDAQPAAMDVIALVLFLIVVFMIMRSVARQGRPDPRTMRGRTSRRDGPIFMPMPIPWGTGSGSSDWSWSGSSGGGFSGGGGSFGGGGASGSW